MTYNIRLGMQRGVARIAEVINNQHPDIVALQEVGRHWTMGPPRDTIAELSDATDLPHHDFITTIRRARDEGATAEYGHAVLSRWPLERLARYNFTQDIDEPRAACIYRIDTPDGPVRFLATHLSHLEAERAVHGPELLDLASESSTDAQPLFVAGDLNECAGTCSWLSTLRHALTNAADAAGVDEPTFPAEDPDVCIDYLLADRGVWSGYEVVEELFASDHRPVVAEWSADGASAASTQHRDSHDE
jgi:endonuclease/exonuclease/phosphatase family metal-dependent hydrolase